MFRMFLFAALLAFAPAALANTSPLELSKGDFAAQRAQIETQLADGTTYVEISPADRSQLVEALDRIAEQLQDAASIDALDQPAKAAVLEDEKLVNNTLKIAARDSRVVCERQHTVGSNRPQRVCQTVAERARRERNPR